MAKKKTTKVAPLETTKPLIQKVRTRMQARKLKMQLFKQGIKVHLKDLLL